MGNSVIKIVAILCAVGGICNVACAASAPTVILPYFMADASTVFASLISSISDSGSSGNRSNSDPVSKKNVPKSVYKIC